jgi:hypothetical protein
LGIVQKKENEEEMLNIQRKEESGGLKSVTPMENEAVAIETMEGTAEDLRGTKKTGHNRISMRQVSV